MRWALPCITAAVAGLLAIQSVAAQNPSSATSQPSKDSPSERHKRVFHLVPTFGIIRADAKFQPLSPGDKLKLGATHAFDRVTLVKSALSAAISQASDAPAGYGQGWDAYG